MNPIPPTISWSTFSGVNTSIPLTVPTASVTKYSTASGWGAFRNLVHGGYSVSAVPGIPGRGSVSGANNTRWYTAGESVSFTAVPAVGLNFVHWTCQGKVVSTSANIAFTVSQDSNLVAQFANAKTINLTTAGTLSSVLSAPNQATVTHLTLTGQIDARDVKCMRDHMPLLQVLDMSGATIVAYTGSEGTYRSDYNYSYPANEMPQNSFCDDRVWPRVSKTSLQSVVLPSGLTVIGFSAFSGCTGLSDTLVLPAGLTSIGAYAFGECTGISGTLVLPAGLTSIGDGAFSNCSGITALVLPAGLTTIADRAFTWCSRLRAITNLSATPPVISPWVFSGLTPSSITLAVPKASVALYQTADVWKNFMVTAGITVTVAPNNAAYGSVSSVENRIYASGEVITLTATAAAGYQFANWTAGGQVLGTTPTLSITLSQTISVVANFKSSKATLATLTLSSGVLSPAFSGSVTNYRVNVGNAVSSITLDATCSHSAATVSDTGAHALAEGANTLALVVTAEDGSTTQTYTVVVNRAGATASTDATLSSLTVSEGTLSPAFASATTAYTVSVGSAVSSVAIVATATHSAATVTGAGGKALNAGDNSFAIVVVAEDGVTTKTYTLTITRDQPTGIAQGDSRPVLSVYPNPTTDVLVIENNDHPAGTPVQVYTLWGSVALQAQVSPGSHTLLDISALATGTYVVKVGHSTAKILKQ